MDANGLQGTTRITPMNVPEPQTPSSRVLAEVRDRVASFYGEGLDAAIVVGSFSRGEEMFVQEQGGVVFLSDIELLFVAHPSRFEEFRRKDCGAALQASLKESGWDIDVSVGITTPQHLRKFKPYIFTLEILKHGQIICGDKDILRFLPAYREQDISRLDALILLNNRIVEQLILLNQIEARDESPSFVIDKGYVQVVNSLLAFEKKYQCLYPDKKRELIQLKTAGQEVFRKIDMDVPRCLGALDNMIQRKCVFMSRAAMMEQWQTLRKLFQAVWLYEIARVLDYEDLNLEQGLKYILSVPDLLGCARGWAKLFFQKQLKAFLIGGQRAPCWFTSPQFLVYRDAARLYFSDNSARQERLEVIGMWQRIVK